MLWEHAPQATISTAFSSSPKLFLALDFVLLLFLFPLLYFFLFFVLVFLLFFFLLCDEFHPFWY